MNGTGYKPARLYIIKRSVYKRSVNIDFVLLSNGNIDDSQSLLQLISKTAIIPYYRGFELFPQLF